MAAPSLRRLTDRSPAPARSGPSDRVVTTGFANLSDGAKVVVGNNDSTPTADLAPHRRGRGGQGRDGQARDGQRREWQGKDGQAKEGLTSEERAERRKRRERRQSEGDEKAQTGPVQASEPSGSGAKAQP